MRLLLCLAILTLTACSDEKDTPASTAAPTQADTVAFALDCTTFTQATTHFFRSLGVALSADEYACTGALAEHTCRGFEAQNGEAELSCETTNTTTQAAVPSGCTLEFDSSGASAYYHAFEDGTTREMSAYFCGYLSGGECWYYRAVDGSNEGDLLCRD